MRVEEAYDLIVIGDQLGGLFLAAGAAQSGMKVLVLEERAVPTVVYEVPSGRLQGDFACEPVIGLKEGSKADEFLRGLGLYQELDQLFPCHSPPLQLVGGGWRLDFPYEAEKLEAELKRQMMARPETRTALARLLCGLSVTKKDFSSVVAELNLPVGFESLGLLQAALYGSLLPDRINYGEYKNVVDACAAGVRYPLGGRSALKERLLSRIQLAGGALRRSSRVEEIVFERRRLSGLLLSSYEGFVRSPRVVGAMNVRTFFGLVPADFRSRRLEEAVRHVRPRAWRFSFTLLVPEEVVPEGMGSHVALFEPECGLEGENFIQLQLFSKEVYGGIPARHRAIVGRILVPFEEEWIQARSIATLAKRALARVESLLPFLREQPYTVSPDPSKLESDPVFQRYYNFSDLSRIPPAFLVYSDAFGPDSNLDHLLDWSAFGLDGLALCSRDIRPLHGLTGELQSAMDLLAIWKGKSGGRKS
jgi:phytoene dehydrogenase-like protein